MKRRRRGSGTILKTPEGTFRARFAFVCGQPREEIDGSPFPTYEDAERALDGLLAELHAAGATRAGVTLLAAGKRALDLREKEGYRAIQSERDRWNAYIRDSELAAIPVTHISSGEVRTFLSGLRHRKTNKPLSVSTRKNILNLLRAVLDIAIDDGHILENPLASLRVKAIGSTEEEMRPLTWPEAKALIAVATDPVVALAIGTGMRSGELRSLHWEDVHLDDRDPHVLVRYGAPNKPRKNGKVHRVPLFGIALETFASMTAGKGKVFPALLGGYRPKGRAVDRDDWKAWLAKAKLSRRVRFHDLRHTCATLLLNGAWGRKWTYEEVKELLDHSSVKVTERYAKVLGTLADGAARAMRKSKNKIGKGSAEAGAIAAKAREILQRRGSDSNRRMTVLQSRDVLGDVAGLGRFPILARSYVEAVDRNDPFAHMRGLDLAEAALAIEAALAPAEASA